MKNEEQFLVIDSAMNNQENAPADNLTCPRCQLSHIKGNGHTYYGKQNHQCLMCGTQFVIRHKVVGTETKELIVLLLLERISLRGICRVAKVSLCWLLNLIAKVYEVLHEDLNFSVPDAAEIEILCLEADEIWSFVGKKDNKRWI